MFDNVILKKERCHCVPSFAIRDQECPICLKRTHCSEYAAIGKFSKRLNCGHVFHVKCINKWLLKNISCPMCRAHVYKPCRGLGHSKDPYKLVCMELNHYNIYRP